MGVLRKDHCIDRAKELCRRSKTRAGEGHPKALPIWSSTDLNEPHDHILPALLEMAEQR